MKETMPVLMNVGTGRILVDELAQAFVMSMTEGAPVGVNTRFLLASR